VVTRPAYAGPGWSDEYYSRIHALPATLDVGLISTDSAFAVRLWNASDAATTILSVTNDGADGVGISGFDLPLTLLPTQEILISVVVSENGTPIIGGELVFETTSGPFAIAITGTRGFVFPFEPDWAEPVETRRFFQTVTTSSLSTREVRHAMAARPLLRISYTLMTGDEADTTRLKQLFMRLGSRLVCVPLWPEALKTTGPVSATAMLLATDATAGRRIAAGDLALVWASPALWSLHGVESVGAASVTLRQAVGVAFPQGAWVAPVRSGHFTAVPSAEQLTDAVARCNIEFEEEL
jgi:hypothetical protein